MPLTTCRYSGHNIGDQERLAKRSRIRELIHGKLGCFEIYIAVLISGMLF